MVTADLAADLRERIAAKQIICVVGAGVAAASARPDSGTEPVLWPRLVESGVRWVRALHPELPPGWVDDRLRALASDDVDDLLAVASQVASKLGAPDGGEYAEWLHRSVGALEVGDATLIQALGALEVPIVTTNYDHLLEKVLHREAISWRNEAAVDRILRGDSSAILHLHGHYSEPESVVLGLWEYAGLVDNEHTQAVMRALGMAKSLLFVGFGAGLRDPNFRQFLRWARKVSWTMPYRHYRLARASEAAAIRRDHDPAERVMVLSYGERYEDLAPFVRALAPREPAAPTPIVPEKTSATLLDLSPPPAERERWDELASLERELDGRMVGEFTLLEVLVTAAAEHADWSKRSARNLMATLARTAANLVNAAELDDVYWWLVVFGVLRFSGIDRWWRKKRDWEHSVDFAEIAPRGKQLLARLAGAA
ncbi:MAG TPA: SIR2 family protein [Polyangia bacterium]|nr:SIR2 family protein [Polyangia bacterium]